MKKPFFSWFKEYLFDSYLLYLHVKITLASPMDKAVNMYCYILGEAAVKLIDFLFKI